ncbi:MAG: SpoIIE family protein phosphatase [Gammaproteobacteria bacterium]
MAKLLVVDDLLPNRLLIRKMCESFGHQTIEAEDGLQATRVAVEADPDLVLLDISMPNMDGYEAARRIKAGFDEAYLPIIFVTADSADTSLAQALSAGGDDFISQPVSAAVLESKISAHLRIRELNHQLVNQNRELARYNRRLRQEADLISHFFDKALQRSFQDPGRISYHSSPASAFNGDLILVERGPSGQTYLLIGDFTGHGLQAAMGTLPVQQAFFELCNQGVALPQLARKINGYLRQSLPESMFFAANLLCFDPAYEHLEGWFGGMPQALLLDGQGNLIYEFSSQHMPLGIEEDGNFEAGSVHHDLPSESRLYLFSDGAEERLNEQGQMLGSAGLQALLQKTPPDQGFAILREEFRVTGRQAEDQRDDISFVEVRCGRQTARKNK